MVTNCKSNVNYRKWFKFNNKWLNLKKPATDNKNFGGLAKLNQTSDTFLNGDMAGSWYNAVCTKASWNNGIPGGNDTAAAQCLLFVRIK